MKINKVVALPASPEANAMYLLRDGSYVKAYITGTTGTYRQIFSEELVDSVIDARLASLIVDGSSAQFVASGSLSGHRIVISNPNGTVSYADAGTTSHANRVLGITTGAAAAGADITVKWSGEFSEPTWNWTPGDRIYLGLAGNLTTSPTGVAFIQRIGHAVSPTTIFLQISEAIVVTA
jgi:hypothetical protein